MRIRFIRCILYLLCIPIFSCNSKKKAEQQILALKEMSDLATVEYVVTKIIKANDNRTWYKIGERKILMSCKATLKAGIDFAQIKPNKVDIDGDEISIELPRAKLLSVNIRPEDIKTEYEEVGLLRSDFTSSEKDELMKQGEAQIRNSADSLGIYQTAETNAFLFLSKFLQQLGYKKVTVSFGERTINTKMD
jgi:Protein of unknown function (DUF4230)